MAARPKPSIRDVARAAGVSAQTVSRVANGHPSVRPATRERVEQAMTETGYVPNRAARVLRTGSSRTIGVMSHRFERTGENLTLGAVVEAAEQHSFSVTLTTLPDASHTDWARTRQRLELQGLDGLVVLRHEAATEDSLLLPDGLPVAVSDSRLVGAHPAVVTDQTEGTRAMVQHLLGLGHRTVHHVGGPEDSEPAQQRAEAWRRTLEEAGAPVPEVAQGDWTAASGLEAGRRLAADPSATAVFCANDEMAFGVMRAFTEAGLRIPQDRSVAGFDDVGLAAYAPTPLSTIRQDFRRIGQELVALVMRQLDGARPEELERVVVPTELVLRQSTGTPETGGR
ncbi:LacI family DNA-binding transcriptional regulator [Luteococcus sp.]|uniref:LacI family DNA-binding transcriptional regulator n=1 Tax=Luteococcus sp. TaxID=1969402 RepID=UPI0037354730